MNDIFREKLFSTLLLIGGFSSIVNVPILFQTTNFFAYFVMLCSLSYIILYLFFKSKKLNYEYSSNIALFILFTQTLNIPAYTPTEAFFLPWLLLYPIVVFSLRSSAYSFFSSSMHLMFFALLYHFSYFDESYTIMHILNFSMLYAMVFVVFYHISNNVEEKEVLLSKQNFELSNMNNTLSKAVKSATFSLEKKNVKLQEVVDNFEDLLDTTMEGIVLIDNNNCIIDINKSGISMLGYDLKKEVLQVHINKFIDQDTSELLNKVMVNNIIYPTEVNIIRQDASILPALISSKIMSNNKTRMATIMDLTDIKQKDKLLKEQMRLAQMGEMISMIAHQWRQPLGAISSAVLSIQTKRHSKKYDLDLSEDRNKFFEFNDKKLNNIADYVQVLSATIDDFRTFFKQDKTKDKVPFTTPISRALQIVELGLKSKSIELIRAYECDAITLMYQNEIMQVILNILKNAEDNFSEKNIANPLINIKTYTQNNRNIISIRDNGGGIDNTILSKIFDPYFSTKNEKNGTGLGLYMSKVMVEEHNQGLLLVANTEDGVEFRIVL